MKEALPGVVKVVSLRRPEWNGPMNGPKMYTREEVAEEGLLWGQVQHLYSLSLSLSEQLDSTVLSCPLCRTS